MGIGRFMASGKLVHAGGGDRVSASFVACVKMSPGGEGNKGIVGYLAAGKGVRASA